jgi:hypothetical protein
MNEDIIKWAREAGVYTAHTELTLMAGLTRFSALVAAQERESYEHTLALQQRSYEREIEIDVEAEREACAKVCDARYMGDNNREDMEARRCAEAIRARGNP